MKSPMNPIPMIAGRSGRSQYGALVHFVIFVLYAVDASWHCYGSTVGNEDEYQYTNIDIV